MKSRFILTGFVISFACMPGARGQGIGPSTLNQTGGTVTLAGNVYDWSVGEMTMVSTFTGSSIIVTQGVLQNDLAPSAISDITSHILPQSLQVFPNPASTSVNLRFTAATTGKLSLTLTDMAGKIIMSRDVETRQGVTDEQVNIAHLAAATYMLAVSFKAANNDVAETTSYKIEKLK